MPRLARAVFVNVPHHITQRGNRREDVFFTDEDRLVYLGWLKDYSHRYQVDILAYCLMTNHVHLVAVPIEAEGLSQVLKPLHMRYAQRLNREKGWKGHVWQGRYFSSPLDGAYLWTAIRYVECNPVRARMVRKAERYAWSSAAYHCGETDDMVVTKKPKWQKRFAQIGDWSAWLSEVEEPEKLDILRRNIDKGLPCGQTSFVRKLERLIGRSLEFRPLGRPRKGDNE